MKRFTILIGLLFLFAGLSAQPLTPAQQDMARTMRGARLSLEADKTILSSSESAQLNINFFLAPHFNNLDEMETEGRNIDLDEMGKMLNGRSDGAPYRSENWKILQGGGHLELLSNGAATFTAPAGAPPDNTMVISVDMIPVGKGLPKVVLLKTLYFESGDNIFDFNVPASGIVDWRYTQKTTGTGAGSIQSVVKIDPKTMAMIPAADRERLQKAQDQVKHQLEGSRVDVVSLTSNANAIYDSKTNTTVLKFLGLARDNNSAATLKTPGAVAPTRGGGAQVFITYTGRLTVGVHSFNGKSDAFLLNNDLYHDCECSMQGNPKLQRLKCGGLLTITSIDDTYIKGTISTQVWNNPTGVATMFNGGMVYGTFKIRKSDIQSN